MISSFSVSCLQAPKTEPETPHYMQIDATAVREDVERVLGLYVTMELFRVGSNMGRLVIDESRATKPPRKDAIDATLREKRAAKFRRALYAKPEARTPFLDLEGHPISRVAPPRDVADIVKLKAVAFGSSQVATDRAAQMWRSTISTKLARVARACVVCRTPGEPCRHVPALITAAKLKIELSQARSGAKHCDSALGSATGRKRLGQKQAAVYEERRVMLRRSVAEVSARRLSIVRSSIYSDAVVFFYIACDENPETLRYCLRLDRP